jgi:signal transduction histidine kinase
MLLKYIVIGFFFLVTVTGIVIFFTNQKQISDWWQQQSALVKFNDTSKKKLIQRVDYMITIIKNKGLDAAINIINTDVDHIGYIFLFDATLPYQCLAHGGNNAFVGKIPEQMQAIAFPASSGTADCNLVQLINKFAELARQGGGFSAYKWHIKPEDPVQLKVSYIKPLTYQNKEYFIGSGFYAHDVPDTLLLKTPLPIFDDGIKNFLIKRVDNVESMVKSNGLDATLTFINTHFDNTAYAFLFDAIHPYKCLAHGGNKKFINLIPAQMQDVVFPGEEGKQICDLVKLIESFASLARKGGGFHVYNWRTKKENQQQLKISYIKPLMYNNQPYFIGTGLYSQNIPDHIIIPNRVEIILKKIERDGLKPVLPIINNETDPESYVFLFEAHPPYIVVAHGGNNKFIGKTADQLQNLVFPGIKSSDYSMPKLLENLARKAKNGGGFHAYLWRTSLNKPEQLKISYSKLLIYNGKEYVIGTGYSSKAVPAFVKDKLPQRVNELLAKIKRDGMKKYLPIIAQSTDRESYFFIDQTKPPYAAVANANKKLIGMSAKNQSLFLFPNNKDEYADVEKLLQNLADTAYRGGGFCVYLWRLSSKEPINLKVSYVKLIDDNHLLGAGYYV